MWREKNAVSKMVVYNVLQFFSLWFCILQKYDNYWCKIIMWRETKWQITMCFSLCFCVLCFCVLQNNNSDIRLMNTIPALNFDFFKRSSNFTRRSVWNFSLLFMTVSFNVKKSDKWQTVWILIWLHIIQCALSDLIPHWLNKSSCRIVMFFKSF